MRRNDAPSARVHNATMLILAALTLPAYQIIDLGGPPDAEKVEAVAINNQGEVLLQVRFVPFDSGYLWRSGRWIPLGDAAYAGVGGDRTIVKPNALNDQGAVVGGCGSYGAVFMSGMEDKMAFVWNGRKGRLIIEGDDIDTEAYDINERGDIVGGNGHRGFARIGGRIQSIDSLSHVPAGNFSSAAAINDRRLIVGDSTYGSGKRKDLRVRPFTADANRFPLRLRLVPLPKGYQEARAYAVSNAGTILAVAGSGPREGALPYLVRRGRVVELPFTGEPLNVMNAAMNEREGAVATLRDFVHPEQGRPALCRDGKWAFLPSFPGWTLQSATGINDKGQICGTGLHDGKTRAFVLTPR